jgi:regulator of protease activity HflC (stomatin/prohibitin superfamily)
MDKDTKSIIAVFSVGGMFLLGLIILGMWGCPQYTVYEQRLLGESELAKANYSKQTKVQEAIATQESASHLADAEIERARGVAQANKIIGTSLKDNEAYLRWLYIEALKEKQGTEVIYVPTEAGLPILEAGKRAK